MSEYGSIEKDGGKQKSTKKAFQDVLALEERPIRPLP